MQRFLLSLGLVAIAVLAAACSGGSGSATASPAAPAGSPAATIQVVAKDLAFSTATITAPAGAPFEIAFDNQDAPPHNIAIKDSSGAVVFKGEIVTQTKITYNVAALAAGTYQFLCEVHPNMTGTLTAS